MQCLISNGKTRKIIATRSTKSECDFYKEWHWQLHVHGKEIGNKKQESVTFHDIIVQMEDCGVQKVLQLLYFCFHSNKNK
jgi:hypothetical protein